MVIVFGSNTQLGALRVPVTIPFGYFQGVFVPVDATHVENLRFGVQDAAALEQQVAAATPPAGS